MGQQAMGMMFQLGGTVIGGFVGGPVGAMVGGMAGGLIGSLVMNRAKRPLIPDLNLMSSSYGNPIPIIWGTVRLSGTVIWMSKVQVKSHGVGKGLGGASADSYWQNVSIAFCEGPAHIVKLYLDSALFFDNTAKTWAEYTNFRFTIREYQGTEDQLPDFLYAEWVRENVNPGEAIPAMRGIAHLVFDKIDLAHFGGRLPQASAIWSQVATDTTLFHQFIAGPADTRGGTTGANSTNVSDITVDWTRQNVYHMSFDGTVRSYRLTDQAMVLAKSQRQILNGWRPSLFPLDDPTPLTIFSTMAVGDNTPLYIAEQNSFLNPAGARIFTIDPNSLMIIGEPAPLPMFHGNGIMSLFVANEQCLAGTLAANETGSDGGSGTVFLINPESPAEIGILTLSLGGIGANAIFCNGEVLDSYGTRSLWVIQSSTFSSTGSFYIWEVGHVGGGMVGSMVFLSNSDAVLRAHLTPADLGMGTATTATNLEGVVLDQADGCLIIGLLVNATLHSANMTFKWSKDTGVVWVALDYSLSQGATGNISRGQLGTPPIIQFTGNKGIKVLDTNLGTNTLSPVSTLPGSSVAMLNSSYDAASNSVVYYGGNVVWVAYLFRADVGDVSVATIILDLCNRVGVDNSMVDVSLVTDHVHGYALRQQKSAGQALADLCHVFQIDMVESDDKLKFVPRGQAPVVTITQDELGSIDSKDDSKFWVTQRAQEQEMPLHLNTKFEDFDLDYQPGSAYARRVALPIPTVFSRRRMNIDLPIVCDNATGRQIAEKWLYTMWAERDTFQTMLSPKHLYLDPGDNVMVDMANGDVIEGRIENIEVGADFSMRLNLASEDVSTYAGSSSPGAVYGSPPQTITPAPFGEPLLFNVPLLQDTDDLGGTASRIYFAAGSLSGSWQGGEMYQSTDGANWNSIFPLSTAADWGTTRTVLGNTVSVFATDYVNTVVVAFALGVSVPSSCSYTDLMNGANACLIGLEIIQFQTITDNGDGTFTLSVLTRGRRGTDWATGPHSIGETIILLEPDVLGTFRMPLPQIGVAAGWKLLPTARFLDQVPITNFAYLGYDLMPYAPVAFRRAPSGADLVLTWHRRTRIGGYLMDGTDTAPLSEESEAYEVYLLANAAALASFNPVTPGTYRRSLTGLTAATVTYTAAMMTTDGFVPATDTMFVVIYQISAVVGRGFQGYQALPAF